MKHLLSLLLIAGLLLSCHSSREDVPVLVTENNCTQPGTVQQIRVDASTEFGLYLPPCYATAVDGVYPVLYLLPGFGGSSNDWLSAGLASVANELILAGEVPSFLIVTTNDSFDDLDAAFIAREIIPYVENHYPTSSQPQHRAVAGGSLGGASAYHLAFKSPELFESVGIFGNGAAMGEEDEIRSWLQDITVGNKPRVFLNCGESDAYMLERAQVLIPLLDEAGIEHTEIFSAGDHSYAYWLSNFPAYLRWLAQGWQP